MMIFPWKVSINTVIPHYCLIVHSLNIFLAAIWLPHGQYWQLSPLSPVLTLGLDLLGLDMGGGGGGRLQSFGGLAVSLAQSVFLAIM